MRTLAHFALRVRWAILIVVILAAFALRIAGIDQQSIWYDEGLSIYYARGSIGDLVAGTSASEHPPLHSLLLGLWIAVCSDSELAVRYLSVWWGVLAVALLYHLGRRLPSVHGTLAALLLATSPLAIWFSQETRGYMMALALVLATVDVAAGLLPYPMGSRDPAHQSQRWRYLAYVVLATAALYTHLYSAFILIALNLAYAIQQIRMLVSKHPRSRWVNLLYWLCAQIAVLILFAPWLPYVAAQWRLNATYYHGAVDWKQIVHRTLVAFSVGQTLAGPWATGATVALLLLAALGTLSLARRHKGRPVLLLLWLWALVPLLFQIALNRNLPKFAPRYLLNALPAFYLLVSAGTLWLFEIALAQSVHHRAPTIKGWLTIGTLLLITAWVGGATARSLANHYLDERLYRPDLRTVAQYIQAHATPDDLIVLIGGHSYPAFAYYYEGPLPVLPMPDKLLPDTGAPIDVRALETLDRAIAGRQNLWLVLWQAPLADPTGLITDELEHTYHRLGIGRTFHNVSLLLFDVSPGPRLAQAASPPLAWLADFSSGDRRQMRLLGYGLDRQTAQPGDTLYLHLYWESLDEMDHDYKVFTQIVDEQGQIVAQQDKVTGAESYPTSHWPPGTIVRDRFMLTVHPDAPPGQYTLIAGLYRPSRRMPRLPVQGEGANGDHVVLAEITILE
jgi:hypothetical protein